jgi:microcystin-dependent protein
MSGALSELANVRNWEQFGTATPEETADYFQTVWEDFLVSRCAHIGEIRAFALSVLPSGWLALDGQTYDGDDYPELIAVLPSGWVSGNSFTLPDAAGHSLVGDGNAGFGNFSIGDSGGSHQHVLTTAEMPAHTHSYTAPVVATDILGEIPAPAVNAEIPAVTGSAGGGQAHNNMPPYLVIVWAIYTGL